MSLFAIMEEKCERDGICVQVCPYGLIEMKDKESYPTAIQGAQQLCINCGHCLSVCPHGALVLETMNPDECMPVRKEAAVTGDQIRQLMTSRRSIRVYKDMAVDRNILEDLMDIVRYAPTGSNMQELSWMILSDKEKLHALMSQSIDWMRQLVAEKSPLNEMLPLSNMIAGWDDGNDPVGRNAPHMILAMAPTDYPASSTDCTIALTYLELAAHALGLGVCWAGLFHLALTYWPPIQESLNIPEGQAVFGCMLIGYPKFNYNRIPVRKKIEITWS